MTERPSMLVTQVAAYLHVCRRTVYYWIARGQVQHFRTAGGSTRIYVDSLPIKEL